MGGEEMMLDLGRLVAEHHEVLFRYAYRLSGSVPDAEDLTQQAFLNAQQKLGQVRSSESVRSWLLAIVRNCFLKSCQKRRPLAAEDLRVDLESFPSRVPEAEAIDRERLQKALDELPPLYRVVLAMFYFEDCSYREIAEKLDLPVGTVMSRLARAKGYLRTRLFDLGTGRVGPPKSAAHREDSRHGQTAER